MTTTDIKTNHIKAWLLAARPQTLTAAAVPVMIGIAFAIHRMGWLTFTSSQMTQFGICTSPFVAAVLCLLFAFAMQIDANFVNDYFDCVKGNDDQERRLGPKRACTEGWITLKAMRWGIGITTIISCLIGLPLILFGGWEMVLIGLACVVFCFLYTTLLSYHGLGDILVLVFFGIVPVCMTYYVVLPMSLQSISTDVVLVSIACGLVINTLLVINNYRDIDNDRKANKITLVVKIGKQRAERLYNNLGAIGMILVFLLNIGVNAPFGHIIMSIVCFIPYSILHQRTFIKMKTIGGGKTLNAVLGETARNILVFGISTVVIILLFY